jgi:hypothetical protein
VGWLKKKKKPKLEMQSLAEISARLRGFILDSQVQNAHELSVILGCSAISDDVAEREEEESDKRVERVLHLMPLLYAHAHSLADGTVEYQRMKASEIINKELPEELWHESRTMMTNLAVSVLVGSLSQLVDMGFVTIPGGKK